MSGCVRRAGARTRSGARRGGSPGRRPAASGPPCRARSRAGSARPSRRSSRTPRPGSPTRHATAPSSSISAEAFDRLPSLSLSRCSRTRVAGAVGQHPGQQEAGEPPGRLREHEERVRHRGGAEPLVAGEPVRPAPSWSAAAARTARVVPARTSEPPCFSVIAIPASAAALVGAPGPARRRSSRASQPRHPAGERARAAARSDRHRRVRHRRRAADAGVDLAPHDESGGAGDVRARSRVAPTAPRAGPCRTPRPEQLVVGSGGSRPRRPGARSGRACAAPASAVRPANARPIVSADRRRGGRARAGAPAQPAPSRSTASRSRRRPRRRRSPAAGAAGSAPRRPCLRHCGTGAGRRAWTLGGWRLAAAEAPDARSRRRLGRRSARHGVVAALAAGLPPDDRSSPIRTGWSPSGTTGRCSARPGSRRRWCSPARRRTSSTPCGRRPRTGSRSCRRARCSGLSGAANAIDGCIVVSTDEDGPGARDRRPRTGWWSPSPGCSTPTCPAPSPSTGCSTRPTRPAGSSARSAATCPPTPAGCAA